MLNELTFTSRLSGPLGLGDVSMEIAGCCHGKERFLKFDLNEQNWLPIKKTQCFALILQKVLFHGHCHWVK
jgi:hypothetical protein